MGSNRKCNDSIIGAAENAKVFVIKFENYEFYSDNDSNEYIIGYNGERQQFNIPEIEVYPNTEINNHDYFNSLFILASNIYEHSNSLNWYVDNNRKKIIMKWVKKHGFPFLGGAIRDKNDIDYKFTEFNCKYFDNMYLYIKKIGFAGFEIRRFERILFDLYDTFLKACAISNDIDVELDLTKVSSYITYVADNESDNKESIESLVSKVKLGIELKYTENGVKNTLLFDNIISLAVYQMAWLLASGPFSIRRCKCCGSLFCPEIEKQEFCENCSPQKYYAQKKRQEQKRLKAERSD